MRPIRTLAIWMLVALAAGPARGAGSIFDDWKPPPRPRRRGPHPSRHPSPIRRGPTRP